MQVARSVLLSAGKPARLVLSREGEQPVAEGEYDQLAANGEDLSFIDVELKDELGIINPKAENLIRFTVQGPATVGGVGNGNPVSLESN